METTLLVTPEQLQTTASDFSSKATQVKALHDSMIEKVNGLAGTWTGSAAEAYTQKFAALQASMDTINSMILEHVNDLNAIAEEYKDKVITIEGLINELPASTLA